MVLISEASISSPNTLYVLLVIIAYSIQLSIPLIRSSSVKRFLVSMPCILFLIRSSVIPLCLYIRMALALALSTQSSGLFISSSLSFPKEASRLLRGSALGEGMDWMIRRAHAVLAKFIFCLPPLVSCQRGVTICPHPCPKDGSRMRNFLR